MKNANITKLFYDYLVVMEQHFNRALFDGALPRPLLTLKRGVRSLGHFSAARWELGSERVGEIALNPTLFAEHSWLSLMQAMVHQQCHLWQHQFGKPSRPGYHNAEWAGQMQKVGLMPSATEEPGGRKTGQRVQEYPMPDGPFIRACVDLAEKELAIPLAGRFPQDTEIVPPALSFDLPEEVLARLCSCVGSPTDDSDIAQLENRRIAKRKVKYSCPKCRATVWGRHGLALKCQECKRLLKADDGEILGPSDVHNAILAAIRQIRPSESRV